MEGASAVNSSRLAGSAGVNAGKSGGSLQQQAAVEAAASAQDQQQQQGQNAIELIQSSGMGQNVNIKA
jgi:K+-transporting ATPase c subunit